jgi:hypothetical protein
VLPYNQDGFVLEGFLEEMVAYFPTILLQLQIDHVDDSKDRQVTKFPFLDFDNPPDLPSSET